MAAALPRWKGMVYATAFAAVTFVGTIYGAGLKTRQEYKTEKKKALEATVDEKVAMLEQRRRTLLAQKTDIEAKMEKLHTRMKLAGKDGESYHGK
ncbi:hypothetical protein VTK73DRAFT_9357 [Phialemonium thermophilum]|uniref:Uncharacterized protein n=1 Tax=Phialemonium thermophilum TaxID=223376 RepID=A0ABR3XL84_9PEZI